MGRYFTEQEAQTLIWESEIDREEGDNRRWSRSVTSIVQADDGKYYAIDWEQGLTECQENEYFEGTYPEVEKVTTKKTVEVTEWKEIKHK